MSAYVVVVDMAVRADTEAELARIYAGPFLAAISAQEGFRAVTLLKPTDGQDHLLVITFAEQSLQERWVGTELHGELWSAMEATFSRYSVRSFHTV